mmetsp:Transcript_10276/g.15454  ORF Transcript_10276/g.15454 Transcript_10276/m.15454 type:complete len:206 (-) Transcript_10276:314-931(-)
MLAGRFEAGVLQARAESAKCLLMSVRPMFVLATLSLILYSLGLATDVSCRELAPEDELLMTCRTHYASCCFLLVINACFFFLSVMILHTEPSLLHLLREMTPAQGLSQAQICKLLAHDYGDPTAPPTLQQCLICLEDFEQGEKIRYLPCGHHFHAGCLDTWLSRKSECPIRCQLDLQALPVDDALSLRSDQERGNSSVSNLSHAV